MIDTVTIGEATLYHGDCLEILPTLDKVDAVVTDPPYGIADKWNKPLVGKRGSSALWNGDNEWDRETLDDHVSAVTGLSVDTIIWGGHYYDLPPSRGYLVWDKIQKFSGADSELAWCSWDQTPRTFRMSRIDAYQNIGEKKEHPTQKPSPLMSWCLSFLPKAELILDPFMGSGTTGVACANLGRKFIGIELERKYFDIACERIEAAYAQGRLF